tara:strand:- start:180 stop:731 length:552 start_codon:yes stop_codon:yes gene_type:complete
MNIYHDCPLDARDFTDYRSSSDINNDLIVQQNLKNTSEFNRFIRKEGTKYFTQKKQHLEKLYGCGPYDNTMLDEKYIETCTKEGCELNNGNKDGLGTGRKMNISEKNVVNNNLVNKNEIKGGNEGSEGHHDKVDTLLNEVNSMKNSEEREAAIEKIRSALANLENSNQDNSQEIAIVEDLTYT